MSNHRKSDAGRAYRIIAAALLMLATAALPCSIALTPAIRMDSQRAVIITGVISEIFCPACDTLLDTTRLSRDIDTSIGLAIEKKIKKYNLNKTMLQIEHYKKLGLLAEDSSYALQRRVICDACEIVIKPLNAFSLPPPVNEISVYLYRLDQECRSAGIRINDRDKYIGKYVTLVGQLEANTEKPTIIVSTFSINSYLSISNTLDSATLFTEVAYRGSMEENFKHLNLILELSKDLVRIDRAKAVGKKKTIVNNLMYHRYYLENPDYFGQMISANLSRIAENEKAKLVAKQKLISDAWRKRQKTSGE